MFSIIGVPFVNDMNAQHVSDENENKLKWNKNDKDEPLDSIVLPSTFYHIFLSSVVHCAPISCNHTVSPFHHFSLKFRNFSISTEIKNSTNQLSIWMMVLLSNDNRQQAFLVKFRLWKRKTMSTELIPNSPHPLRWCHRSSDQYFISRREKKIWSNHLTHLMRQHATRSSIFRPSPFPSHTYGPMVH